MSEQKLGWFEASGKSKSGEKTDSGSMQTRPMLPGIQMENPYPGRWKPKHADYIQLYSLATPNGQKVAIALEELGFQYETHIINIVAGDQFDDDYTLINPNSKIPTIIDPNGPNGKPIALMESGAILLYLAEKSQRLMPTDPVRRLEAIQWLNFQLANVGPIFGQFGHFNKFARDKCQDSYSLKRYTDETHRLLGVLDRRLYGRKYLAGEEFSIADIATVPWMRVLDFYGGKESLDYNNFESIEPWVNRCLARPGVASGMVVAQYRP